MFFLLIKKPIENNFFSNPPLLLLRDLGDIVLGAQYIERYCRKHQIVCLQSYLARLVVHGTCHLLGYTHDCDTDHEQMIRQEKSIIQVLKEQDEQFQFHWND